MEAYAAALLGGGAYETYFADDIVLTMTGVPGEITGPAAAKAAIDAIHHEQFDATPEVTNLVIGEGTAAIEAVFVGTHTGEFAGIAATGTAVEVPYSVFYELADGQITALRIYALAEGLVQQLQAAPSTSADAPRSGTLHLTKECSEYTGEAGSFCTIASSNFAAIPTGSTIVYAEAITAAGLDTDISFQYPRRRHRRRPCGPRWRDPDWHDDAGGRDRAIGEPRRRPRGRPARRTHLQLGRAVLVLGATSAGVRRLAHRRAATWDRPVIVADNRWAPPWSAPRSLPLGLATCEAMAAQHAGSLPTARRGHHSGYRTCRPSAAPGTQKDPRCAG